MSFKKAVQNHNTTDEQNVAFTANGAVTNASSLNDVLDFFSISAAVRGKPLSTYLDSFEAAYTANRKLTLQNLLWLRDVRGGAGERGTFRTIMLHLEETRPDDVKELLPVLAEFGRWDDLLIFQTAHIQRKAYELISTALDEGNALCAKWMPRIYKMKKGESHSVANENRRKNNIIARGIMNVMNIDEKKYRKLLSHLSNTVETQMCDHKWDEINYSGVPSIAMTRYTAAFQRNDEERFTQFGLDLASGVETVNASALFPYDLTTRVGYDDTTNAVLNAQWDSLPLYIKEGTKMIPMCDTSSSMNVPAGETGKLTAMNAAMALSLYVADKQDGVFKDMFLTFDDQPKIFTLQGKTMSDKYHDLQQYRGGQYWGGSTDIGKAFKLILDVAKFNSVPQEDMPETLIIFSDMEFNETNWRGSVTNNGNWDMTAYNYAKQLFADSGYTLPNVVFWNLNGRPGNNPVTVSDEGTAMVSGFSPAVLKSILSGEEFNPLQIMLETIDAPRYQVLK